MIRFGAWVYVLFMKCLLSESHSRKCIVIHLRVILFVCLLFDCINDVMSSFLGLSNRLDQGLPFEVELN